MTIFNSPWEVIVQAQLVAQGEPVVQSQGAILGRSLGCRTRTSPSFAKWSHLLAFRTGTVWVLLCFPSALNPQGHKREGGREDRLQSPHSTDGESKAQKGQFSSQFLSSPSCVGADLGRVGAPTCVSFDQRWDRGPGGDHVTPSDLLLGFQHT